jgi:Domain of Unknown Function (DUF1259)
VSSNNPGTNAHSIIEEPEMTRRIVLVALTLVAVHFAGTATAQNTDWTAVEDALGYKGAAQPGGVFRIGMPRTDLKVTVQGVPVKAGFALGSYAAFRAVGKDTMVMGDLVLLDEEVPKVMSALLEHGFEITAVHNHLNEMSPHVMYMHYSGHGAAVQLAQGLRTALGASATPFGAPPASAGTEGPVIDQKQIETALGRTGRLNNGVLQITVPRAERVTEAGTELLPAMGVATVINFQPTADGKAAVTGDFVLIGREVNAVARALRSSGIAVTALHNHGLADNPRLFYMHFWANDDAMTLARGLRSALDRTNAAK